MDVGPEHSQGLFVLTIERWSNQRRTSCLNEGDGCRLGEPDWIIDSNTPEDGSLQETRIINDLWAVSKRSSRKTDLTFHGNIPADISIRFPVHGSECHGAVAFLSALHNWSQSWPLSRAMTVCLREMIQNEQVSLAISLHNPKDSRALHIWR
jgi:hypothetical protein